MLHFGLIGYPLGHSASAAFFSDKFAREHIDADYRLYEIPHIDHLSTLPRLDGFNVTSPFKEAIFPYLDALDTTAAQVGAVNVVKRIGDRLIGYNTDTLGFGLDLDAWAQELQNPQTKQPTQTPQAQTKEQPPTQLNTQSQEPTPTQTSPKAEPSHPQNLLPYPMGSKALILGTGGAAKAVYAALQARGFDVLFVSRTPGKNPFATTPQPSQNPTVPQNGTPKTTPQNKSTNQPIATPQNQPHLQDPQHPQAQNAQTPPTIPYSALTPALLSDYRLIVQATPLGMGETIDQAPDFPFHLLTSSHYLYDCIYNPASTLFLQLSAAQSAHIRNGKGMHRLQALATWDIWRNPQP